MKPWPSYLSQHSHVLVFPRGPRDKGHPENCWVYYFTHFPVEILKSRGILYAISVTPFWWWCNPYTDSSSPKGYRTKQILTSIATMINNMTINFSWEIPFFFFCYCLDLSGVLIPPRHPPSTRAFTWRRLWRADMGSRLSAGHVLVPRKCPP